MPPPIGTVSLDGTKVKANASKHKAMSWGYANRLEAQLREEVQRLLEQAARADTEASPGPDIPEELERREARLAAIERAKAEIERRALKRYEAEQAEYEEKLARRRDTEKATGKKARGREPKAPVAGPRAKDQVNFTDEESRIMPSAEGFVQGYNAQAAVDIDSHLIVAEHVSDHTNDKQELAPALRCLDERQEVVGSAAGVAGRCGLFQRRERQALRGRGNRAIYREWSEAPPSAAGRAVSACAGVSRAGRWCRGDEASHEDPRRQSAVRQAKVHGGDGLWSGQGGDGVPTISSARA